MVHEHFRQQLITALLKYASDQGLSHRAFASLLGWHHKDVDDLSSDTRKISLKRLLSAWEHVSGKAVLRLIPPRRA